jgi:thiamine biosynthesis lipoprotein
MMVGTGARGAVEADAMDEVIRGFRAMNTDVLAVVAVGAAEAAPAAAALDEIEQLFAAVEACASRFRPESELSQLNRSAGHPFAASPVLYALVAAALEAAGETGGAFDPTLLDALERAGYDRSFDQLPEERAAAPAGAPPAPPGAGAVSWRSIRLDPVSRTITLPAGCRLDLGGIGKGWTVDQACARLRARGLRHFALDAGGDLYAVGRQGNGEPWSVGVEDPDHPTHDLAVLAVDGSAVATSTTARRHWRVAGELRHHLIDPRTRQPAASGVVSATVVADTVARAEVLAKAALVLGPAAGRALLERRRLAGLLVLESGGLLQVGSPVFTEAP